MEWIGLHIRCEMEGETIWLVETLRDGVKYDCLVNILRNGKCNGLAEEGSLWRVFVFGMWIVVGCADVQKILCSHLAGF